MEIIKFENFDLKEDLNENKIATEETQPEVTCDCQKDIVTESKIMNFSDFAATLTVATETTEEITETKKEVVEKEVCDKCKKEECECSTKKAKSFLDFISEKVVEKPEEEIEKCEKCGKEECECSKGKVKSFLDFIS